MNNPQKRNALSLAMLQSLEKDLLHEVDDKDLRVIVIADTTYKRKHSVTHVLTKLDLMGLVLYIGHLDICYMSDTNGPVFSSGHNLKEFTATHGKAYHADVFNACVQLMTAIQTIPVPVIAQVNGLATAAGCQLVASCDIAVASEKSRFATPGVNVGLFCSTPAVALGRAVPRKVALEMLFTGEPISAHDALMHGLVSKVVPEDSLEAETMKIAHKICQASRIVVALGKATFYKQISQSLEEAYRLTSQVMLQNLMLKDGQEGIEAFTQKRKPVWTNSLE
ncbi:enoyl-CoA hydratase domain-containing protein 3, mitochondrial isoform X3 [Phyllobates terribilis]